MQIDLTRKEIENILDAFGVTWNELGLNEDEKSVVVKLLTIFPELEEQFHFLREVA